MTTDDGDFKSYEEYKAWKDEISAAAAARPVDPEEQKKRLEWIDRYSREQSGAELTAMTDDTETLRHSVLGTYEDYKAREQRIRAEVKAMRQSQAPENAKRDDEILSLFVQRFVREQIIEAKASETA
jgi:hypothetical protein